MPWLLHAIDQIAGVREHRSPHHARRRSLEYHIPDSQPGVARPIVRTETSRQRLLPPEPPLAAEILEIVHLPAGLPVHVDRAQRFRAKDAGSEAAAGIGEQEYRIP